MRSLYNCGAGHSYRIIAWVKRTSLAPTKVYLLKAELRARNYKALNAYYLNATNGFIVFIQN